MINHYLHRPVAQINTSNSHNKTFYGTFPLMCCLFFFVLFFGLQVKGQDNNPLGMTFNHVALSVKDVDRAATFYGEVLQLKEITNRTKMEGIRWFALGEGKELHLISVVKEPVTLNKAVHFAMMTAQFDAFVEGLRANKVPYEDWMGESQKITIRADGIKQVYVQDPDGYWIEVNSAN